MPHVPRRRTVGVFGAVASIAALALVAPSAVSADRARDLSPRPDPAGIINLPRGFSYDALATSGATPVRSTESGKSFLMPEDSDANVVVRDRRGRSWLLTAHELTAVRPGETFLGDDGKAFVPEQATVDDGDVDGWGSVTRIPLTRDGRHAGPAEVITTGLHNLCAGALTPWGTFLVNEEFPFPGDTTAPFRSGWVWEIDPTTGAQTKLTGMGRFSHEQEALAADGAWYLTDDLGTDKFLYRFVPDTPRNLVAGTLYGLLFNKATGTGTWVEIPDANLSDPHGYLVGKGYNPATQGFSKGEGIVATPDGKGLIFAESGTPTSSNAGRVWKFTDLTAAGLKGSVIAEGSFDTISHPDNVRFTPSGDLLILEDNGSALGSVPATGGMNGIWVLPKGKTGTANARLFATLPFGAEPTGPWFSTNGRLLYLSIQGEPSRTIVIRGPWQKHHDDDHDD